MDFRKFDLRNSTNLETEIMFNTSGLNHTKLLSLLQSILYLIVGRRKEKTQMSTVYIYRHELSLGCFYIVGKESYDLTYREPLPLTSDGTSGLIPASLP